MVFNRKGIPDEQLLDLYKSILKPRMIEEKMLILLRQGKISKWFSGIGQEAIAVGVSSAMEQEEYILPMHRNLGVFTTKGVPLNRLFSQFQGKMNGFTKGRDRSFHFGSQEHKVVGMISHLGPQLGVADGIALANKLKDNKQVTAVFTGEGGTSEGDFHEALNVAAVWDLPVIFIVENNGYGLSTPTNEQFRCQQIADKGKGFGIESYTIDGNNLLEVYRTISQLRAEIQKKPKPILLECMTFRMRGHEEASGTKYVPQEKFDKWQDKDPVHNYEQFLILYNSVKDHIHTRHLHEKAALVHLKKSNFRTAKRLMKLYSPKTSSSLFTNYYSKQMFKNGYFLEAKRWLKGCSRTKEHYLYEMICDDRSQIKSSYQPKEHNMITYAIQIRDIFTLDKVPDIINSLHEPVEFSWINNALHLPYKKKLSNALVELLYSKQYWHDQWSEMINHEHLNLKQQCMFYELSNLVPSSCCNICR